MPKKRKLRFIANPLSGTNRNRDLSLLIKNNLNTERFEWELCYTQYAGHAIELSREGVINGCYMVVACGGDGSVNEVASQLINTNTILGVLPCGSGNGFAGHLGIGRNVTRAFRFLNEGLEISVDACTMNGKPFVNLSGVGFDAVVAQRLHGAKVRGFWGYLKSTTLETFNFKSQVFDIQIDNHQIKKECILVEVANAPIYGYGFSIVPIAKLNDGLLEILVAKKAPIWRYAIECWRFLDWSFHKSSLVEVYQARKVVIKTEIPTAVHLDGEGFDLKSEAVYEIQPSALKVMVPRDYVIQNRVDLSKKNKIEYQSV
jgi:diacylglycerol kinase (ATP)